MAEGGAAQGDQGHAVEDNWTKRLVGLARHISTLEEDGGGSQGKVSEFTRRRQLAASVLLPCKPAADHLIETLQSSGGEEGLRASLEAFEQFNLCAATQLCPKEEEAGRACVDRMLQQGASGKEIQAHCSPYFQEFEMCFVQLFDE